MLATYNLKIDEVLIMITLAEGHRFTREATSFAGGAWLFKCSNKSRYTFQLIARQFRPC